MPGSNMAGLAVSLSVHETWIYVIDDADAVIWRRRWGSTGEAIGAALQGMSMLRYRSKSTKAMQTTHGE